MRYVSVSGVQVLQYLLQVAEEWTREQKDKCLDETEKAFSVSWLTLLLLCRCKNGNAAVLLLLTVMLLWHVASNS